MIKKNVLYQRCQHIYDDLLRIFTPNPGSPTERDFHHFKVICFTLIKVDTL